MSEAQREVVVVPAPRRMRPLRFPTDREAHAYMRMRQEQNRAAAQRNGNEQWVAEKLRTTGHKWKPQAQWGYRVFDFWCHTLGIAVEVDGPSHDDPEYDAYRDEYNYRRSGIVVLRVRNRCEEDAAEALRRIAEAVTWQERRAALGLNAKSKKARRALVSAPA